MGALLGLVAGAGCVLVLLGLTTEPSARRRPPSRAARLVAAAGVPGVTTGGLLGACAAMAAVGGAVALLVTALPVVAVVAALLAGWLPVLLLKRRARVRERALRSAWPDAVDALVSGVRAGMSLPEAVADLERRGPEPLRPAFAAFGRDWRASGSFGAALERLTETLSDPVADRVSAALRIAREVGGTDLGRVLRTLADFLRADARMRGEIEARQSWTVNAARLAVAAPWITLALLCTRPETVQAYSTAAGSLVLAVAAVLSVVAYRMMLAVGRLPAEPRVLR